MAIAALHGLDNGGGGSVHMSRIPCYSLYPVRSRAMERHALLLGYRPDDESHRVQRWHYWNREKASQVKLIEINTPSSVYSKSN